VNTNIDTDEWIATTSAGKKWAEKVEEASEMFKKENKERKAKGQPPKVISGGRWGLIREYFPGTQQPPTPQYYNYEPKEFAEAFKMIRAKFVDGSVPLSSGLGSRRKKMDYSFNVVQFVEKDGQPGGRDAENFKKLTKLAGGEYQTVSGLEEIQNYASAAQ
jgi:hypothetical protein